MAIPTTIESLSVTAASNGPSGSDQLSTADDGLRQAYAFIRQLVNKGSDIASATTITPPSNGSVFAITGTTAITTIASTNSWDGRVIYLVFAAALTLTHGSNLNLRGSVNITTAANDVGVFLQTSSGVWRLIDYERASGVLVASGVQAVVSGVTTNFSADGSGAYLEVVGANDWRLLINSVERMRVKSGGQALFATQPGMGAYRATSQFSGATLIFDTEDFDTGSHYNATTGVFTAPIAGKYQVSFHAAINNATGSTANLSVGVYVNGTEVATASNSSIPDSSVATLGLTRHLSLAASDTVDIRASSAFSATLSLTGGKYNGLSIRLLG